MYSETGIRVCETVKGQLSYHKLLKYSEADDQIKENSLKEL